MMMVHRTGGSRGNLEVERQITPLGKTRKERRIRRSLESADPKLLRRAHTTIDKLIADERWDVLRAYRDGAISTSELLSADRKGKASRSLAGIRLQQYLWDRTVTTAAGDHVEPGAISKAMARVRGDKTRHRYLQSFKRLQQRAGDELDADAKVIDLLRVSWDDLYDRWDAGNADWMHLRRSLSRFATLHTNDKWSRFARKLRAAIPTKKVKKRRPTLTIEQFLATVDKAPAHAAASVWVLVITGVRVISEYLASGRQNLDKASFTYTPPGANKNSLGDVPLRVDPRWWPYLERGIPSRIRYKWLRIHWARALKAAGITEQVTLHDLRHCHGQWAINAKVAESKVQGSLRHENPAQTRDYVMQAGTLDVSTALADAILKQPEPTRRKRA